MNLTNNELCGQKGGRALGLQEIAFARRSLEEDRQCHWPQYLTMKFRGKAKAAEPAQQTKEAPQSQQPHAQKRKCGSSRPSQVMELRLRVEEHGQALDKLQEPLAVAASTPSCTAAIFSFGVRKGPRIAGCSPCRRTVNWKSCGRTYKTKQDSSKSAPLHVLARSADMRANSELSDWTTRRAAVTRAVQHRRSVFKRHHRHPKTQHDCCDRATLPSAEC